MSPLFSANSLFGDLKSSVSHLGVDLGSLKKVFELAFKAHSGQFREMPPDQVAEPIPYITHPVGVAKLAARFFDIAKLEDTLTDVLSAALLHDVLEDTQVDLADLRNVASSRTLELVLALTKPDVSGNLSRSQRNERFMSQIRQSGRTAAFLKLMDSLHNLSRPQSMPGFLLAKTINKASREYSPLMYEFDFEGSLRDTYLDAIECARASISDASIASSQPASFQEYLQLCFRKISGKTLELHDALDLLLLLPGFSLIYHGSIRKLFDLYGKRDTSGQFLGSSIEVFTKLMNGEQVSLRSGLDGSFSNGNLMTDRVMAVRFDDLIVDEVERNFIVFSIDDSLKSEWVSWEIVQSSIVLLAERHRNRQSRYGSELGDLIASLRIHLSTSTALRAGLNRRTLRDLRDTLESAETYCLGLVREIDRLTEKLGFGFDQIKSESRVKSPESLVRKMIHRRLDRLEQVDDVVGIRVVLPNRAEVKKLSRLIEDSIGSSPKHFLGHIDGFSVSEVHASSGYRATHICFSLTDARNRGTVAVACEIQLRTVFEDAWARLSHVMLYKSNKVQKGSVISELKRLSKLCSDLDELADGLGS